MISNGPSRCFTQESVESWFIKLSEYNWEEQFTQNALLKGRALYLKGKISGIDVSREQLIFSRKENREEFYSVMEWQGKRLDFRTSLDDESFGRAIAVAGLYELEQLITEIHENNPMLGTIESSGVQNESRKTDQSDENKEVTNEKNNNKFAVELLI